MATKRKIDRAASDTAPEAKKVKKAQSSKGKEITATAASSRSQRIPRRSVRNKSTVAVAKPSDVKIQNSKAATASKTAKKTKPTKTKEPKSSGRLSEAQETTTREESRVSIATPRKQEDNIGASDQKDEGNGVSYWLMKAEPESRVVNGKDLKFSIDDLKVATKPEPWDGVRNYVARNHMRAMKKGDLAFFYHSNCKVPGVVGIMEIVQEHSVDETAHDPEHPYYDAKSKAEDPKWSVVHVEFRKKFPEAVTLKDLQSFSKDGGVLESLQVLKSTRLSVSKVSKREWDFINGLAGEAGSL